MANYKKFLYISNAGGIVDEQTFDTESGKTAYIMSHATDADGKWFKTLIFRAATNELQIRGCKFGLSVADGARITNLETAVAALNKAQLQALAGEKVISITDGTGDDAGKKFIKTTLNLSYDSTSRKVQLKGIGDALITEFDATAFIKDGMLYDQVIAKAATATQEVTFPKGDKNTYSGLTVGHTYIFLEFNNDDDKTYGQLDATTLVDVYDAANINLTSAYSAATAYTESNITAGASMDTVVGELVAGIKEAYDKPIGVNTVGGKDGDITLRGGLESQGSVNLTITDGKQIQASIVGLGDAAYEPKTSFVQTGDTLSATGATTDGYVSVSLGGTKSAPTVTVTDTVQDIATSSASKKGLAEASNVKEFAVAKTDTLSASGESTDKYSKVVLGGTKGTPTVSVTLTEATYTANASGGTFTNGVVTNAVLESVLDDLWQEF